MIRICHLITGLNTGGAERMLIKLLAATDRERFQPTVISLMDRGTLGDQIEALNIPLVCIGLPQGRPTVAGGLRLLRQLRHIRPHLLQGWMYHGNLAATVGARLALWQTPVIWNIRQSLYALEHERPLTRAIIRLSAALSADPQHIVYNASISAEQHERAGFSDRHRVLIANGFNVDHYRPDRIRGAELRRQLGVGTDTLLIGMAARYHPMKDHAGLLQAAAQVIQHHPSVHFALAGTGVDDNNRPLTALIEQLGLAQQISLLGERSDMPAFFQALDLAVMSSAWGEGFPNVLGEAMACGVPCITTAVGDAPMIVGDTGLVVPAREPGSLADAIDRLIRLGDDRRHALGDAARARVIEQFALASIARQYEDLYAETLGPRAT